MQAGTTAPHGWRLSNIFQAPFIKLDQASSQCVFSRGGVALNLADQGESRLAFNDAHDGLPVVLADDGISFPVADPAASLDNGRAIIDRQPLRNNAAPFDLAVTLLATQVLPQQSACSLVRIDSLIHRFWTDGGMPAALLWTPLLHSRS